MSTIREVYEKWKNSQSAKHIEHASNGEHSLERGYIGDFAIDCWAAIKAHVEAAQEPCVWTPVGGIQIGYYRARCVASQQAGALPVWMLEHCNFCPYCGAPLVRNEASDAQV